MQISLENLIGQRVFLVLRDVEPLNPTGINQEQYVSILRGYDQRHGLWFEFDSVEKCSVKSNNKPVENCPAVIFVPWRHIVSISYFPDKDNLEIDRPKERKIGFRQE